MSYNELLESEGINAQYLIILRPSRRISDSFTLSSGSVYYVDFSFGYIYSISINGTQLTSASSTFLSAGQFYYDHEAARLYLRKADSTAPSGSDYIIATYELFVATFDAHHYRIPTDNTSTVVYFEPIVSDVPEIRSDVSDLLFGILPIHSTSLGLINAEHWAEKHVYDSSFLNKEILVYHWLDELSVDNVELVMRGTMQDVSYGGGKVSIKILDGTNIFEKEFRSNQNVQFYNLTDFTSLDPQFEGKPIRTVYGVVDGFVPVNISYVRDNPTTSNNRTWAVRAEGGLSNAITRTVPASPASTNTRTYINSAAGFKIGDSVWIDKTTDEYRTVTAVNLTGSNYIEHAALSSGAAATNDTVKKGNIGYIDVVQNGKRYSAMYNRDWTESTHASGTLTFTFSTSLESNLSLPNTLNSADTILCRVYGKQNNVTKNALAFGTNSTNYANLTNPVVILWDILKTYQGLEESKLDGDSFDTALAGITDEIGFAIPEESRQNYPKIKDVLVKILSSVLLRLYQDFTQLWTIKEYAPIVTTTKEITEIEILRNTINYSFNHSDIYSDFIVRFNHKENNEEGKASSVSVTAENLLAKYLHEIKRTYEHESLHIDSSGGAQTLCNRLSYILGDRDGTLTIATKNKYFDNVIGDNITVTLKKLPGNAYDGETEFSRDFQIAKIDKSLRSVKIVLADQKGAQDNEGSW